MELERAYEYMTPEDRRRVKACIAVCSGMATTQLERMASVSSGFHANFCDAMMTDAEIEYIHDIRSGKD